MWEERREPFLFVCCSIDLQPPAISSMTVQRVDCTSDLSPSALGKPSVSDNEGPNTGLQITAGQRTMSGQNWVLTGQILGLPDILSGLLPTRSKKF